MRPALLLPLAAVLLAPVPARADPPPRVSVRLDYQRGDGAARCPGEQALRDEVAALMGYDPFDAGGADKLVVVVTWRSDLDPSKRHFEAHVQRFAPNGDSRWNEDYPGGPLCGPFIPSLASEIQARIVPAPTVAKPLPAPELPPAPPPELPPAPPPELPAVQAPPPAPELPGRPPGHDVARGVAIASYAVTLVFAGLGTAYTAKAAQNANAATTLRAQVPAHNGDTGCLASEAHGTCGTILSDLQAYDTAAGVRNVMFGLGGATAAVGIVATVWSLQNPNARQASVRITAGPRTLTIRGTF
jgi:hypothetical protein